MYSLRTYLRLQLLPLHHRLPGCGLMMLHYSSLVLGSVNGRARRPQDTGPHFGPRRAGVNSVVSGVNRVVCDCFGLIICMLGLYKVPRHLGTISEGHRLLKFSFTSIFGSFGAM